MAQQVRVLSVRADHLSAFPGGPPWWEERTDLQRLLSDVRMCAVACTGSHRRSHTCSHTYARVPANTPKQKQINVMIILKYDNGVLLLVEKALCNWPQGDLFQMSNGFFVNKRLTL